jgi:ferredoxin--NADP+ reductase
VASLLADLPTLNAGPKPGAEGLTSLLSGTGPRVVSYDDWLMIDQAEISRGMPKGKPREKFTRIDEMLDVLTASRS